MFKPENNPEGGNVAPVGSQALKPATQEIFNLDMTENYLRTYEQAIKNMSTILSGKICEGWNINEPGWTAFIKGWVENLMKGHKYDKDSFTALVDSYIESIVVDSGEEKQSYQANIHDNVRYYVNYCFEDGLIGQSIGELSKRYLDYKTAVISDTIDGFCNNKFEGDKTKQITLKRALKSLVENMKKDSDFDYLGEVDKLSVSEEEKNDLMDMFSVYLDLSEEETKDLRDMFIVYQAEIKPLLTNIKEAEERKKQAEIKKAQDQAEERRAERMGNIKSGLAMAAVVGVIAAGVAHCNSDEEEGEQQILPAEPVSAIETLAYGSEFQQKVQKYCDANGIVDLSLKNIVDDIVTANGMGRTLTQEEIKKMFGSQIYLWGANPNELITYLFENQPLKEGTGTDSNSGTDTDKSKDTSCGKRTMKIY